MKLGIIAVFLYSMSVIAAPFPSSDADDMIVYPEPDVDDTVVYPEPDPDSGIIYPDLYTDD